MSDKPTINGLTASDRPTDAERAAQLSILLTQEGRLELAEAVLRLAIQAYKVESGHNGHRIVNVPFIGATRSTERPAPRLRVAVPVGDTDQGQALLDAKTAQADYETGRATAVIPAPPVDRRCAEKVLQGNVYAECHGAVYWVAHPLGDPAGDGFWRHVDTELDNDHVVRIQA